MIELKKYADDNKTETINRMAAFFDFHKELINGVGQIDQESYDEAALKLYYNMGYDSLSLITVRKEFGENKRDRHENVFGLDFKY